MATAAERDDGEGGGIGGEYKRPDAAAAFKIYDKEIAPKLSFIAEKRGDLSDPYCRIKDTCNYPRSVLNFIVALEGEEDAKRDHLLLALSEGLRLRKLYMPRDLVTMADGVEGQDIVPSAARERPRLVAVDGPAEDDSDLADPSGEEPTSGTGAAAIAAMKAAAAGEPDDDDGEDPEDQDEG